MSDGKLCAPQVDRVEPVAKNTHHAAHAHHHADSANELPEAEQPLPVCCDHACLSEVSVLPFVAANSRADHRIFFSLSSGDRPDLIGLDGLRRPPRA